MIARLYMGFLESLASFGCFCGLVLASPSYSFVPAHWGNKTEIELNAIQGVWQLVYMESEGAALRPDLTNLIKWTFKGKQLERIVVRTNSEEGVITEVLGTRKANYEVAVDGSNKPKSIDITLVDEGYTKGLVWKGIYILEADLLLIAFAETGDPRPRQFGTGKDSKAALMVFKRIKTEDKK